MAHKYTARNSEFLAEARATWNDKIYKIALDLYNSESPEAAANFLQKYTTAPIPGASVPPPAPLNEGDGLIGMTEAEAAELGAMEED